jgi:hypothetical protein
MHGGSFMSCIGSHRRSAVTVFQQFGLAPFRKILSPDLFARAAREAGCGPRRRRPLVPEVVVWLMMYVGLQTTSMTQGLCQAWGLVRAACPWLRECCVREEAFCQARKQLNLSFWRHLFNLLTARFESRFKPALLWKGALRVLAVDGVDIRLPSVPALVRFFGKPGAVGGNARQPQAKLVALCSVFTGFCVGFKLLTRRYTEHAALIHLIRRLRATDLVLMDRGFFSLHGHLADSAMRGTLSLATVQTIRRVCRAN